VEIGWRQCLGWFSGRRAAPVLGVDISPAAVRVIELSCAGERLRVERYARRPMPPGAIRDGNIIHAAAVSQMLAEALDECGTPVRRAALALPSGLVIRKILSVSDDLSDEELESQVDADAEGSLPFSLDELGLDFAVIGPCANEPGKMDVMLVAARREKINERLALAEAAGLDAVAVDVESQALLDAVAFHDWNAADGRTVSAQRSAEEAAYALVQLGQDSSQFSVIREGQFVFERELSIGLHKLEQEISRRPGQAAAFAEAFHDVVCQEIRRAIQLHASAADHAGTSRLLLAGPTDRLPMLPAVIADRLSLTVQLANPFGTMTVSAAVDQALLQADASCCLVACGLAMVRAPS
jgi:type IV pilus assembly protein PilM